jgi:uncharacterized protein
LTAVFPVQQRFQTQHGPVAVEVADGWWRRAVGLLGRRDLPEGQGLLLRPCRSIHTWFMRFPIDVVYLDDSGQVLKVAPNVRAWRFSAGPRHTRMALELRSGECERLGIEAGSRLG